MKFQQLVPGAPPEEWEGWGTPRGRYVGIESPWDSSTGYCPTLSRRVLSIVVAVVPILPFVEMDVPQIGAVHLPGDIFGLENGDSHRFTAEAIVEITVGLIKSAPEIAARAGPLVALPTRRAVRLPNCHGAADRADVPPANATHVIKLSCRDRRLRGFTQSASAATRSPLSRGVIGSK